MDVNGATPLAAQATHPKTKRPVRTKALIIMCRRGGDTPPPNKALMTNQLSLSYQPIKA